MPYLVKDKKYCANIRRQAKKHAEFPLSKTMLILCIKKCVALMSPVTWSKEQCIV